MTTLYTIGFAGKSAEEFFAKLKTAGVKKVVDVRLYPTTLSSGFARKKDLAFFLKNLCGISYQHNPNLAPTEALLKGYKNGSISWAEYQQTYTGLLQARHIGQNLNGEVLEGVCLLCAEALPDYCHRRLLAEYLAQKDEKIAILHL